MSVHRSARRRPGLDGSLREERLAHPQGWRYRWLVLVIAAALMAVGVEVATTQTPSPYTGWSASTASSTPITNMPPQAAGVVYGEADGALPYAHAGALVVAGRDNYDDKGFRDVSAAGGTVLIYLNPVIDNSYGRYHRMLVDRSICGPSTSRWPGEFEANEWGYLNDFRVGSAVQRKLECVLERMVSENPHMAGWFADDIGSRSWYSGIEWDSWKKADQEAYRAGAIALTRTFRTVANRHGLIFIVNGTWGAGSLAEAGGGYPEMDEHGNALADGGFVEYHDGEIEYFGPYACSAQWAADSPLTKGKAFNYAVTMTAEGFAEYRESRCFAFVNQQADYGGAPAWGKFHRTGLPSHVRSDS